MASSAEVDKAPCNTEVVLPLRTAVLKKFIRITQLITEHFIFQPVIITVIFINAIILALETDESLQQSWGTVFDALDSVFMIIYTLEFILKVTARPKQYWSNGYDVFDFIILFVSYIQILIEIFSSDLDPSKLGVLKVLRAFRTFRTLRTVSYIKGLQVLVISLLETIKTWVFNIILLLLLIMFLFAIMGYYFFGYHDDGDKENWGTFGRAMLTLLSFVTADGWTDFQNILEEKGYTGSVFFTITFIILGNFIFTNIFVGVIIMNISDATDEFRRQRTETRCEMIRKKKQYMMDRQHSDVQKMWIKQREGNYKNFQELVRNFQKTLHHDDSMMMSDICTNLVWIETLIRTLDHMDSTVYRVQQLHFEMANHLAQVLETRLNERSEKHDTEHT